MYSKFLLYWGVRLTVITIIRFQKIKINMNHRGKKPYRKYLGSPWLRGEKGEYSMSFRTEFLSAGYTTGSPGERLSSTDA